MIKATKHSANVVKDNQEKVMEYYLGIKPQLGKLFLSPFRKDKNPSCSFYYSPQGTLYFHDFGTAKKYSAISLVMEKFGLTYPQAMDKVRSDLDKIATLSSAKLKEVDVQIGILPDALSNYLTYWTRHGISLNTLIKFGVGVAKSVYRNDVLFWRTTKNNPIYTYLFPSGNVKLYRPLSPDKDKKWYGNSNGGDIAGMLQLPRKGTVGFITSSMKDVMLLHELGFPAIAPSGEAVQSKEFEAAINIMKKRFRYVFVLMDSDDAGTMAADKLCRKHGLRKVFTPLEKDPSDFRKKYGHVRTFRMLKKILSRYYSKTYVSEIPF